MECMDPVMCKRVWLMTVVVCVYSLGVWVSVCMCVGVRGGGHYYYFLFFIYIKLVFYAQSTSAVISGQGGGGQEGYVFCCDDLYYGINVCFLIQYVCS